MFDTTWQILDQLDSVDWFRNVGNVIPDSYKQVTSWEAAIKMCIHIAYERVHWQAQQDLWDNLDSKLSVHKEDPPRSYNTIVDEVKAVTQPMVTRKLALLQEAIALPKTFTDQVRWDVIHIGISTDYADVHTSPFYTELAHWYLEGHLPCGWRGKYPAGKFVIF